MNAPLWRLVVRVAPEDAEVAGALLVQEGEGGAVEESLPHEAHVACFGEDRAELERLGAEVKKRLGDGGIRAACKVARAPRAFDSWRTEWTEQLEPIRISARTWLVPTGSRPVAEAARKAVWLEPAFAFGFGEHPTTRMAAREVERRSRTGAPSVLDFGSGSGVLALVAVRAGATRATGVDVDPVAVHAARRNALRNGAASRCRFTDAPLGRLRSRFDLVVANVDRATLVAQAASLSARLRPGGVLLLTGFLTEDVRSVLGAYRALGFGVTKRARDGDWILLSLRRASPRGRRGPGASAHAHP